MEEKEIKLENYKSDFLSIKYHVESACKNIVKSKNVIEAFLDSENLKEDSLGCLQLVESLLDEAISVLEKVNEMPIPSGSKRYNLGISNADPNISFFSE